MINQNIVDTSVHPSFASMKEKWEILMTSSTKCRKCSKPLPPKMEDYRIETILYNLIDKKLNSEEVERLIPLIIEKPYACPCEILRRKCHSCEHQTLERLDTGLCSSGCMEAMEYYFTRRVIYRILGALKWQKIILHGLVYALSSPEYQHLKKIVEKEL